MPNYDVTSPDGQKYRVTAPDGASESQVLDYAKQQFGQQQKEPSSGVGDFLKSIPRGAVKGFTGAAEFVKEGLTPRLGGMDVQGIQKGTERDVAAVEGITGPLHQPEGTAGKFGATVGEFVGNPLSYIGPGGMASKAVGAVTGALGSEAAGQLTEGTALEGPARLAGAAIGGGAPRTAARGAPAPKTAPTTQEILAESKRLYNHPAVEALELKPTSAVKAADDIGALLKASPNNFRPITAPQTFEILNELKTPAGGAVKVADIDSTRQALGVIAGDFSHPTEQAAASRAIAAIDDWLANVLPTDVVKGDAAAASAALEEARGNYAAASRSDRVAGAEYRADMNASSAHSGSNIDNATRQAIKGILLNPKKRRGFSDDEIEQMERIVKGTFTGNTARWLGKLFGHTGIGGLMTGGAGFLAGGPAGAVGLPAAGMGARAIGDLTTSRGMSSLDEMVRARSPLAQKAPQDPNAVLKYLQSQPPEWQQMLRSMGAQQTGTQ